MSRAVLGALFALLFRGGTDVLFPLVKPEEQAIADLRPGDLSVSRYACKCSADAGGVRTRWRFDRCVDCGTKMKEEKAGRGPGSSEKHGGGVRLWFNWVARDELGVVRLSSIRTWLNEKKLELSMKGAKLSGAFQIHAASNADVLADLRKLDGIKSAEESAGVYYINQLESRPWPAVKLAEVEKLFTNRGVAIDDLSWVVTRCLGTIGFVTD